MEPETFERWVLGRLRAMGLEAHPTPRTGDGGADGVARDPASGRSYLLQCKHRQRGSAGPEAIEDLLRAREAYGLPQAFLLGVSNQDFTTSARAAAQEAGVTFLGREEMSRLARGERTLLP